ncbi:aminodeoxychorismate synthase component I [Mucilaginibacter sp. PPCGB 2223]|uniref:anthranilate synthase component I family protein n=1 Tax=Mucilaginibacter sp. PPCGB 2223 TaxID=1886027 RepID=UPI00082707D8|nr:anthranilate synthase component I family protein [Mucilaginibacter sp. PPCGB 2223]OCX51351.1 aminodeoxychorismate synthase component I [Mucilaginibacter sp. PPCGB 2223]
MILYAENVDPEAFKQQALQWASGFEVSGCLDSGNFGDKYSKFNTVIAAGVQTELKCNAGNAFNSLAAFREQNAEWLFGFLTYDLKNEIENLSSANSDHLQFPDLYFFAPQHLILIGAEGIEIISAEAEKILEQIERQHTANKRNIPHVEIKSRFNKGEYIDTIKTIQQHIVRGDIYETNFCQEFYVDGAFIDPLSVFRYLNEISPAPFSCFFKFHDQYIISASPERFMAKRGDQLISQPIKGTARRSTDVIEDEQLKNGLKNHPKEQQENVMIVDLVRNDLTKSAVPGTVKVEELFGIYSFEQVHQMISTVSCIKDETISDVEAIRNTFPMGSMTGAPKVSAMQLMEKYERTKRGVYSGAVGYFDPDGDFDFNVVIRTILYNAANQYLSFQVGSAITHNADPEKEYEECLLKAKAILQVLGQQ